MRDGLFFASRFGNRMGTKSRVVILFSVSKPHKGNRIISKLAEACGSRTHCGQLFQPRPSDRPPPTALLCPPENGVLSIHQSS